MITEQKLKLLGRAQLLDYEPILRNIAIQYPMQVFLQADEERARDNT